MGCQARLPAKEMRPFSPISLLFPVATKPFGFFGEYRECWAVCR